MERSLNPSPGDGGGVDLQPESHRLQRHIASTQKLTIGSGLYFYPARGRMAGGHLPSAKHGRCDGGIRDLMHYALRTEYIVS